MGGLTTGVVGLFSTGLVSSANAVPEKANAALSASEQMSEEGLNDWQRNKLTIG
ncbi:hypothetical protein NUITMVS1_23150 [Shewanella xiamenensis]|nr:hypothetical protein NUITMVS1_23150 [Shewanella xiamenensis]GLD75635.1 hypothetical protein NUITMVS3_00660 [Shewanella xiamenensis]